MEVPRRKSLACNSFVLVCVCLCMLAPSYADDKQVNLLVRTLLASKPMDASEGHEKHRVKLDQNIKDLRTKLEQLPYKKFQMLSSRTISVPPKKKVPLKIDSDSNLNFRLLYANEHRAGIWLNWLDSSGMELLNTRMHFNCTEPMVAGTENTDEEARLVAVSVQR